MRSVVLGLLVAAIPGCNQIFGLDLTVPVDAGADAPPIDSMLPTARLTYLVALTDSNGAPITLPVAQDIDPPPDVQIGLVGGPLMPATVRAGGYIDLPYDYPTEDWRLVYTVDGKTREAQFTATSNPHVIVPRFGRIERAMIPGPNSAYTLSPAGFPAAGPHTGLQMYTTGVWMKGFASTFNGTLMRFNPNVATPLSGPRGAPEMAKGDVVYVIEYGSTGGCQRSRRSIQFQVELGTGDSTPATTPAWPATFGDRGILVSEGLAVGARLAAALGLPDTSTIRRDRLFGHAVSTRMPAFTHAAFGVPMPTPAMITLLNCVNPATDSLLYAELSSPFEEVAQVQVSVQHRLTAGPFVTAGIEGIITSTNDTYRSPLDVAIPIGPFELGGTALADTALPPSSSPLALTFGLEQGSRAHYFEVTLHRVDATLLVPVRTYTVPASTAPSVSIDPAQFAEPGRYVFEIRSFLGAPGAPLGDFTVYEDDQSSAIAFTPTFTVP